MGSSIELWLHYLKHCIRSVARFTLPWSVLENESLGRELYSGHIDKRGNLNPSAFEGSARNGFGISVSRLDKAPRKLFIALGLASAVRRRAKGGKQSFKGFAVLTASKIRAVTVEGKPLNVYSDLTKPNPLHANIPVPPDQDKDFYLMIAGEIIENAKPQVELYQP